MWHNEVGESKEWPSSLPPKKRKEKKRNEMKWPLGVSLGHRGYLSDLFLFQDFENEKLSRYCLYPLAFYGEVLYPLR